MSPSPRLLSVSLLLLVVACGAHAPPGGSPTAPPSDARPAQAASACTASQFVACTSGEDCATRGGALVTPHACFDHARDACNALSCAHGCNLHYGPAKLVLCAPNSHTASHMTRCGGLGNWACPEDTQCHIPDPRKDDAQGTCVAIKGGPVPPAP